MCINSIRDDDDALLLGVVVVARVSTYHDVGRRQQRGNGLPERDAGRVFAGPGVGTSPKARERFCEGPPRTGRVSFVHTGGSLLIV